MISNNMEVKKLSINIASQSKYLCTEKTKLKEIMKEEGFIFKDSSIKKDEYFVDVNGKFLSNDTYIRIRSFNDKKINVLFKGVIESISSLDIAANDKINIDVSEYESTVSLLADLGYYKYISLNILTETYVKKEKEYYYNINIDTIEDVGEFVSYDIYTEDGTEEKTKETYSNFEKKISKCLIEKIEENYIEYASKIIYNNKLKGDYLKKVLVELEKIFNNIDEEDLEKTIKSKFNILNLELIEKLEQKGIEVNIVYSNTNSELVEKIKKVLNKIGYNPNFINIKEIKEIAVRETLILENQKKISFSEVGINVANHYQK